MKKICSIEEICIKGDAMSSGLSAKKTYTFDSLFNVKTILYLIDNSPSIKVCYGHDTHRNEISRMVYKMSDMDRYLLDESYETSYILDKNNKIRFSKTDAFDGCLSYETYKFFIYHKNGTTEVITDSTLEDHYYCDFYDTHNNRTRSIYENHESNIDYEYDDNGNLIKKKVHTKLGTYVEEYMNDDHGNCVMIKCVAVETGVNSTIKCQYEYDSDGDIIYEKDRDGNEWRYYYKYADNFMPGTRICPKNSSDIFNLGEKYYSLFNTNYEICTK